MRLGLYSDLHLELMPHGSWQPPALDVDVMILAGDIASHTHGLAWGRDTFRQRANPPEVVYVAGNHEYYDAHLGLLSELKTPGWKEEGIHFLERETLILPGVRILGCTLWSAFDLYGKDGMNRAMADARQHLSDYWMIKARNGQRLSPVDTWELHEKSVRWLDYELTTPFEGTTVVVTHFAPHRRCIAPRYEGDSLTPYFVTDMTGIMTKHQIDVWCFGHTHYNVDFIAEGGCRVVSNQRGYRGEVQAGNGFRPDLIIEL
ncbi:metallophosphoesterase [Achromobacter aloeverae]|uniref:Calcineurin-like phosphoesterase domain-containing protein n=1 Tax=Achromobacter aloeverae TaxID=1750518 RepID=A0A4Q1HIB6_9BURK|nr:metallophosphoesterase [Achromobacter aloeverae]RXN87801.1 hypothetical protein C7R54_14485 [Achromobacter aloeverae]